MTETEIDPEAMERARAAAYEAARLGQFEPAPEDSSLASLTMEMRVLSVRVSRIEAKLGIDDDA